MDRKKIVLIKAVASGRRTDLLECMMEGAAHPSDMAKDLGVSRASVDKQLGVLLECNLIEKVVAGDTGGRPRIDYCATPLGRRFYESLDALTEEYLDMLFLQYQHESEELARCLERGDMSRSRFNRELRIIEGRYAFIRGD